MLAGLRSVVFFVFLFWAYGMNFLEVCFGLFFLSGLRDEFLRVYFGGPGVQGGVCLTIAAGKPKR